MTHFKKTVLCASIIILFSYYVFPQTDSATILKKIDNAINPEKDFMTRITEFPCNRTHELKSLYYFRKIKNDSALILIDKPATEKGIALIEEGGKSWVYSPHIKKFFPAKDDELDPPPVNLLMKIFKHPLSGMYNVVSTENSTFAENRIVVLTLRAKSETESYPSVVLWILQSAYLPVKVIFSDEQKIKNRTIYFFHWSKYGNRYFPSSAYLPDEASATGSFRILFSETIIADLPDFIFTRAFCEFSGN